MICRATAEFLPTFRIISLLFWWAVAPSEMGRDFPLIPPLWGLRSPSLPGRAVPTCTTLKRHKTRGSKYPAVDFHRPTQRPLFSVDAPLLASHHDQSL